VPKRISQEWKNAVLESWDDYCASGLYGNVLKMETSSIFIIHPLFVELLMDTTRPLAATGG
jgi:hypothetical protein